MSTATHEHFFPVQPPVGTVLSPGPCACGVTWANRFRKKAGTTLDLNVIHALIEEYGGGNALARDELASLVPDLLDEVQRLRRLTNGSGFTHGPGFKARIELPDDPS